MFNGFQWDFHVEFHGISWDVIWLNGFNGTLMGFGLLGFDWEINGASWVKVSGFW